MKSTQKRPMRALALAVVAGFCSSAFAGNVFIRNATVYTQADSGVLQSANILVRGDRIVAVGKDVQADADSQIIDAQGRAVTPGLMNAHSGLGAVEIESLPQTNDTRSIDARFGAAFDFSDFLNPDSVLLPYNRMMGLTRAVVSPSAGTGVFAGQSSLIQLGEGQGLLVSARVAQFAHLQAGPESTRVAQLLALRAAFDDARDYRANKAAVDKNERRAYSLPLRDLEALWPVLDGKQSLVVAADRAQELRTLIKLKKEFGLKLVILGAAEGHRVARELAAERIDVIVAPMENVPGSFDTLGAHLSNAARLHAAGVRIALTSNAGDSPSHNAHLARQGAGNAVAHGLPFDAALAALTRNPAEMFGIADRYGKIAAGYDADLVVWSGDPLEVTSFPDVVLIRGENQSLQSRATLLRERYRQAGQDIRRAYPKP